MNELTISSVVTTNKIQSFIYVVRGQQIIIDSDLAMLYNVETKVLNQAVSRNIKRFPERFRFQLTKFELENLKSQNVTSSLARNYGGRRYMPYAFTEQGIAMLSSVLRSDIAIQVSIRIMDTFVEMRKYLANNSLLLEKVYSMESRQIESELRRSDFEEKTEKQFEQIFDYIASHEEQNQRIFFDGQVFDAFSLMADIINQAEKTIELIDGYVDIATLNILAKKNAGVEVIIYTLPSTRLSAHDIHNFNAQYPRLDVKYTTIFHDRFLMLDGTKAYHIGASLKDAGKKCFAINKIEDIAVVRDLIQKAQV
ncbi:MAG: ORF6N domain-containing protein [Methanimicrococcus sp.]|nr:ORF6N domain-containing protein [Methanimicrococcus sp.]